MQVNVYATIEQPAESYPAGYTYFPGYVAQAIDDDGAFIHEAVGSTPDLAYDALVKCLRRLTATTCCDCGTPLAVLHPAAQSICAPCATRRKSKAIAARTPRHVRRNVGANA